MTLPVKVSKALGLDVTKVALSLTKVKEVPVPDAVAALDSVTIPPPEDVLITLVLGAIPAPEMVSPIFPDNVLAGNPLITKDPCTGFPVFVVAEDCTLEEKVPAPVNFPLVPKLIFPNIEALVKQLISFDKVTSLLFANINCGIVIVPVPVID